MLSLGVENEPLLFLASCMLMDRATFEAVVHEAIASIPEALRAQLMNVDVVVEAWPSDDDLRMADVQEGYTLFGLYTGVPLTDRTSDYNMVLPDKITIYQGPLQDAFGETEQLRVEIRNTVIHEVAHFFGLSDADLVRLGVS